ncbi:MAG: alanine racemase [Phycisphaerae bacterium]
MQALQVSVQVDLARVRENAEQIRRATGVPLRAVIKADAYGLGAREISNVLADLVEDFCYFTVEEARDVRRPGLCLGPAANAPEEYAALRVRPSIATVDEAARFAGIPHAVNFDTGMNRFGCELDTLRRLLNAGNVVDVWTHAANVDACIALRNATASARVRCHGACSSLLDQPAAWLDGVRPGVALYRGALRVTVPLIVARRNGRPAGYTQFHAESFGVIPVGYSHGLRAASAHVNGRAQRIVEVGMNTAFVTLHHNDRIGDQVVLLGGPLTEKQIATETQSREHEVMCRYGAMGVRTYLRNE